MSFLVSFIVSTLRLSVPIVFAALGGVISEQSGVVNIGLEGMMLVGAFGGVVGTYYTNNPFVGILAGIAFAAAAALLHAFLCVSLRMDQVVSGMAINILASGATGYCLPFLFSGSDASLKVAQLPWHVFALLSIPLAIILHVFLYHTSFGLRIRGVGENPEAAEASGISVFFVRYSCVLASGVLAGLGGVYLSISHLNFFVRDMSAGRGFIALAAVILGRWTPLGAFGAGLLFGSADALQFVLTGSHTWGSGIPVELLNCLPYILTIIVLAWAAGKAAPPQGDGIPYDPNSWR